MNTYEINKHGQVVPHTNGRQCTDTRAWRDATELELAQRDEITQLEKRVQELSDLRDEAVAANTRQVKYADKLRGSLLQIASGVAEDILGKTSISREEMQTIARNVLSETEDQGIL